MAVDQTFQPNPPAAKEVLASLIAALPKCLPESYLAFLARSNGGKGFVGERYVWLWRAEELMKNHMGYKVAEFFPNFFFFGTDGGGEAYAFDTSRGDSKVYDVPFIGAPTDARPIADSLEALLDPSQQIDHR